jgi:type II secretory pathway pseudopilin PulG
MSGNLHPTHGTRRAIKTNAPVSSRPGQKGYALVALLALMTLLVISMMAAVPNLRQQNQRELEKEAIVRGEEVAEAIRIYYNAKNRLPTSMDELVEGVEPFPGAIKKVQILRAYAAHDPLSKSGEWRLIKLNDAAFIEFIKFVAVYNDGRMPQTRDEKLKAIPVPQPTDIRNIKTEEEAPNDEDTSTSGSGQFIGVASRSRRDSVLTYYDIEREDKWVFTPLFR